MKSQHAVGGGCINDAAVIGDGARQFFLKTNSAALADMFVAEAEGLNELRHCKVIRVPEPICWGSDGTSAYLVLEYIAMTGATAATDALLGKQLAALHAVTQSTFGWSRDNTIGRSQQVNTPQSDWAEFWREQRLGVQANLAQANHYTQVADRVESLMERLPQLLDGHSPVASLLHGDLWGGNFAADEHGQPVIYDPAVYFGDRETDVAMTELFGGFSSSFYQRYRAEYPLDAGYPLRKTLYNLYHVLNHLNLFGGSYAHQAERMIDQLMSELR